METTRKLLSLNSDQKLVLPMGWEGRVRNWLLVGMLLLLAVVVARKIGKGEFDYNVDESQHAATGLFVSTALRDLPFRHPMEYAEVYYAQYPAMSGIIHWPPIFYLAEGAMFRLFGGSVITARLTILWFAVLGWVFWFRLVRQTCSEWTALLSTVLLALLPSSLLFEKTVMLEIPCLSLCIVAVYYWHQYLRDERQTDLYLFAAAFSAAMLTKHNAIFLPLFCVLSVAFWRKWGSVLNRKVLGPVVMVLLLLGPFYGLVYAMHWKTIAVDLTGAGAASTPKLSAAAQFLDILTFYIRALPEQVGWPVLLLAIAGLCTQHVWSKRESTTLMLSWVFSCYVMFTLIFHKEPRYSFYWTPAFTYFAAGFLTAKWNFRPARVAAAVAAIVLTAQSLAFGWRYERPNLSGFSPLASRVKQASNSGVILFDAPLPANFIFFLRTLDSDRHFVVLRKAIWAARINIRAGSTELARTVDDVRTVIDRNGVKFVVVSDAPTYFEGQESLRELVQSDPTFRLMTTIPIESNEREWKNVHLYLYENTQSHPPRDKFLRVRMMTLPRDIVVPWQSLGQPTAVTVPSAEAISGQSLADE
jgi:4-amino-4-deoxy-L-arabinose transferase-like glycosyltransferase